MRILPGRAFPPDQGAFFYRFRIKQAPSPLPTTTALHRLQPRPCMGWKTALKKARAWQQSTNCYFG